VACKLCTNSPIKLIRELDREINDGELSLTSLSVNYGISTKRIRLHMKRCLGGVPQTGYAVLQKNLRSLQKLAGEVKEEYDGIDPYDEDSEGRKGYVMRRMLDITKEQREHVISLDKLKPSEQLATEILNSVATPLVLKTTDICTQELRRLRKELLSILGEQYYDCIDSAIKDALLRIGELLNQEVDQITPALKKILNTEYSPSNKRKNNSSPLSSSSKSI